MLRVYYTSGAEGATEASAEGQLPTVSLKNMNAQGTRLVVISNYFNGCYGGQTEASGYQDVEAALRADPTFPNELVVFLTVLAFSNVEQRSADSTASSCESWINYRAKGPTTIILGDQVSINLPRQNIFRIWVWF